MRFAATHAVVAYLVLAIGVLIALRASIGALAFLSVGWIFALALLPLIPWLLPRFGQFLKEVSPYVQSVKLGTVELEFRSLTREAITVPTGGVLAAVPNDFAALSSGTTVSELIKALRQLRRLGGGPVGIIDLKNGQKWRLPNLYFLAALLEADPVVTQLVVTEIRGSVDGHFVGTCTPNELRRQIDLGVPGYQEASQGVRLPQASDLADPAQANMAAQAFSTLSNGLTPFLNAASDLLNGFVTSEKLYAVMGAVLSSVSVEAVPEMLTEMSIRTILGAPHRFVPTTVATRITGYVDRDVVALAVARKLMASS